MPFLNCEPPPEKNPGDVRGSPWGVTTRHEVLYIKLLKVINILHIFFIWSVVQVVGPADGSAYVIDYYGPRLTHISRNMDTFYKPRE